MCIRDRLYKEDGYFLVKVDASIEPIDKKNSQRNNITFTINEGKKMKIKDIIISGGGKNNFGWLATKSWLPIPRIVRNKLTLYTLRRQLKDTKIRTWWRFWASSFDQKKFNEDLISLNSFYKDEGHRDFNVLSDSVFYNKKKRGLVVQITVNEGAQYKFRNFSWEGNSLYEEQILQTTLNLKKGDIFNQSGFDKAVYQDVQSLYMDRGYLYSNIEPFFTPTDNDSIDVHFSVTENNKVYVRNINIYGNSKTRENVIRRELDVFPGDLFRRTLLQTSMRKLLSLIHISEPTRPY